MEIDLDKIREEETFGEQIATTSTDPSGQGVMMKISKGDTITKKDGTKITINEQGIREIVREQIMLALGNLYYSRH